MKILKKQQRKKTNKIINLGELEVIYGRAGSGKTTACLSKVRVVPDADKIKVVIPEFEKYGGDYVHKASLALNEELINDALEGGYNTVVQTTGWHNHVMETLEKAKDNNYFTQAIHVLLEKAKSMERAVKRFEDGELTDDGKIVHRLVDPDYIKKELDYVDGLPDKFKEWLKASNERQAGLNKRNKRR